MATVEGLAGLKGRPAALAPLGGRRTLRTSIALFDQIIVSGSNFAATVLLARMIGVEAFGVFSALWLVVLMSVSIHLGLIAAPLMTIGADKAGEERALYHGAVLANALLLCGAAFLAYLVAAFLVLRSSLAGPAAHAPAGLAAALAIAGTLYLFQDYQRRVFFIFGRPARVLLVDGLHQGLRLLGFIGLGAAGHLTVQSALWTMAGAALIAILAGQNLLPRAAWPGRHYGSATRRHWHSGKWMTLSGLLHWLLGNGPLLVVGILLGPAALGAMRAGQNLAGVLQVALQAFENIVPPAAARAFGRGGTAALRRYLARVAVLGAIVLLPLGALIAHDPALWLELVYGPGFTSPASVLIGYFLASALLFHCLVVICALRVMEVTRPLFTSALAATVISLTAAFPAVRLAGIDGAIAAMVAGHLVMLAWLLLGAARLLGSRPAPAGGRILGCGSW